MGSKKKVVKTTELNFDQKLEKILNKSCKCLKEISDLMKMPINTVAVNLASSKLEGLEYTTFSRYDDGRKLNLYCLEGNEHIVERKKKALRREPAWDNLVKGNTLLNSCQLSIVTFLDKNPATLYQIYDALPEYSQSGIRGRLAELKSGGHIHSKYFTLKFDGELYQYMIYYIKKDKHLLDKTIKNLTKNIKDADFEYEDTKTLKAIKKYITGKPNFSVNIINALKPKYPDVEVWLQHLTNDNEVKTIYQSYVKVGRNGSYLYYLDKDKTLANNIMDEMELLLNTDAKVNSFVEQLNVSKKLGLPKVLIELVKDKKEREEKIKASKKKK